MTGFSKLLEHANPAPWIAVRAAPLRGRGGLKFNRQYPRAFCGILSLKCAPDKEFQCFTLLSFIDKNMRW